MAGDAVAVRVRDVGLAALEGAVGRRPGEVVAADLDVVVRELAELVVVHAEQLGLVRGAQLEAGRLVDGEREDGGDDERVGRAGDDVRELDVELLPSRVEEAARQAVVDAVEADDGGGADEGVGEEAEHARDAVLGEDVHGVVDLDPVLDCNEGEELSADVFLENEQNANVYIGKTHS